MRPGTKSKSELYHHTSGPKWPPSDQTLRRAPDPMGLTNVSRVSHLTQHLRPPQSSRRANASLTPGPEAGLACARLPTQALQGSVLHQPGSPLHKPLSPFSAQLKCPPLPHRAPAKPPCPRPLSWSPTLYPQAGWQSSGGLTASLLPGRTGSGIEWRVEKDPFGVESCLYH